jgi:hypothetical protein
MNLRDKILKFREKIARKTENTYVLFYHKDGFQEIHYYMPQDLEKFFSLEGESIDYNDAIPAFLRETNDTFEKLPEWAKSWGLKIVFNPGSVFLRGKKA